MSLLFNFSIGFWKEDFRRWQVFLSWLHTYWALALFTSLLTPCSVLLAAAIFVPGLRQPGTRPPTQDRLGGSFSHFGVPYKSSGPGLMLSNEKRQRHTMLVDDVSFLTTQTWAKWANQPSSLAKPSSSGVCAIDVRHVSYQGPMGVNN